MVFTGQEGRKAEGCEDGKSQRRREVVVREEDGGERGWGGDGGGEDGRGVRMDEGEKVGGKGDARDARLR